MTDRRNLLQESLVAIERLQARLDASERARSEPIAIVGAGCRFPGGIENLDALWRMLRDGSDVVAEVPADRWDVDAYYDPDPQAPGKMVTRRGGFLQQVDQFDPQFFSVSPREAAAMDPQQRLLLETAWEALETAGIATDGLVSSATGVFVGITTSDYGQLLRADGPYHTDVYSATGSALNAAAGRLSFAFGLQGPCVAVDTACSSSLVAIHLACQSLRAGESDLGLAGGVNVILSPDAMVLFSKWGMMAPDGACKTFDDRADGFVRSEGCALIALRRLSDALAAGDPILAVLRGSAVNSDGRSSGLTVPNGPAQEAVIRKALANAGLQPGDIDYVEAHGTGTPLGDPIEAEALGAVFSRDRDANRPLLIGSIKTNIGHAEAASGVAGLLKVVTALNHGAIPPHQHFAIPNARIDWSDLAVRVPTTLTSWPRGERARRAGVSSFGFSGTNAHLIVEEAPLAAMRAAPTAGPFLIPLSARDDAALRELALHHADNLSGNPDTQVADVARTTALGRSHLPRRLALLAETTGELERDLRAFAAGQTPSRAVHGTIRSGERPRIGFLFTGQGAQYSEMGRALYADEPVFRAAIDRAAEVLKPLLDRSLLEVLHDPAAAAQLRDTAYTQPALFALEYALAEQWRAWGITPSVVAGHSVGEYVAACVAGVFSFEDGLRLVAQRGRLMQALPSGGAMAAVFASEELVSSRLTGLSDRLSLAAINGPEETVVSGDIGALNRLLTGLAAEGIRSNMLEVSQAFHSPLLDPMLDELERAAHGIAAAPPQLQLISNVTGKRFAPGASPTANYWRRHARDPVRFAAAVEEMAAVGVTALVEIGPHPVLTALVKRVAPAAAWSATWSLRRGREDRTELLAGLAQLHVQGAPVRWSSILADRGGRRVALPTYPFQRERFWHTATSPARPPVGNGHPLLGERRDVAAMPGTSQWQNEISLETHPWLADHRVEGAAIFPPTAYIEMALAAGREVLGNAGLVISEIETVKPIVLDEGFGRLVQATLVQDNAADTARFTVHSRPLERRSGTAPHEPWEPFT